MANKCGHPTMFVMHCARRATEANAQFCYGSIRVKRRDLLRSRWTLCEIEISTKQMRGSITALHAKPGTIRCVERFMNRSEIRGNRKVGSKRASSTRTGGSRICAVSPLKSAQIREPPVLVLEALFDPTFRFPRISDL